MDRKFNKTDKYNDIINLPHHVSLTRKHMAMIDRAAQFSPFAALTGYGEAIEETARLTDKRIELDDNQKELLNEKLLMIDEQIADNLVVSITYFKPDEIKSGGAYLTVTGTVKKIDRHERKVKMKDGTIIHIEDIINIDGEIF